MSLRIGTWTLPKKMFSCFRITVWIMNTMKVSQIALHFGVDDLEGTVRRERIYHDAGAATPEWTSFAEIVRIVKDAGKRPVERNVRYEEVRAW